MSGGVPPPHISPHLRPWLQEYFQFLNVISPVKKALPLQHQITPEEDSHVSEISLIPIAVRILHRNKLSFICINKSN